MNAALLENMVAWETRKLSALSGPDRELCQKRIEEYRRIDKENDEGKILKAKQDYHNDLFLRRIGLL